MSDIENTGVTGDTGGGGHIEDELPRLLTGEASREQVDRAVEHLRSCTRCRDALVELVAVHAPLASAARFAPEAVRSHAAEQPLPDLTELFEQARADHEDEQQVARTRRRAPLWLAAAAVAGLVVGGGGVAALTHHGSSSSTGTTVALSAYGAGKANASMKLKTSGGNNVMKIDAAGLPAPSATQRYEVWLTNAARSAMQPVGWLGEDNTATISVPSNLTAQYSNVEVSVQSVTAPSYQYSGTSVLRGSY